MAVPRDKIRREFRCTLTGNPCGTDTWAADLPCACPSCQRWLMHEIDRLARRVEVAERLAWGAVIVEHVYLWRCHHQGSGTHGCNVHRPVKTDGDCSCGVDRLRGEIRNALADWGQASREGE